MDTWQGQRADGEVAMVMPTTTTKKGDMLEDRIFALFASEIENDRFWAKRDCCKIFRKKGYFSRDRQANIVFDVSIEIYLPGALEYSLLVVVECKNYENSVPVDDVEEFFAKLQQISGANIKGIVAAASAIQRGAREYAKSKGIGIIRYFDRRNYKWELRRSASAAALTARAEDLSIVDRALSDPGFISGLFDLFAQSPSRLTNSIWDFIEDLVMESGIDANEMGWIENSRNRQSTIVPFVEKERVESLVGDLMGMLPHASGETPLEALCEQQRATTGLRVLTESDIPAIAGIQPLGSITFDPLEIRIYQQPTGNRGRERFTLAHELGHHFLGHGAYMTHEYCEEMDFQAQAEPALRSSDIRRIEWQANCFASCLLMPRRNFYIDALRLIKALQLRDRGVGPLYVDYQGCNLQNFANITDALMRRYGVSRAAATFRLEDLGLLVDGRTSKGWQQPFSGDLLSHLLSD